MTEAPPAWHSGTYEKTLKTPQGICLGTETTYAFCGTNKSKAWALEWGKMKELPEQRHVSVAKRLWHQATGSPQHGASARLRRKVPVPAANGAAAVARNRSALPPCGLLRALRPPAPRPGPGPRTQKKFPTHTKTTNTTQAFLLSLQRQTPAVARAGGVYTVLKCFWIRKEIINVGTDQLCPQASSPLFSPRPHRVRANA